MRPVDNVGRSVSRHAILNTVLGIVAATLVAALIYLQVDDSGTAGHDHDRHHDDEHDAAADDDRAGDDHHRSADDNDRAADDAAADDAAADDPPPTTLPPTTLPPADRALVPVVVTSAGLSGDRVGPGDVSPVTGWVDQHPWRQRRGQMPATTIFYADGFQNSAEQMALDMALPLTQVAPLPARRRWPGSATPPCSSTSATPEAPPGRCRTPSS